MRATIPVTSGAAAPATAGIGGSIRAAALVLASVLIAPAAFAQETESRAQELLRQRQQKATALRSYTPSRAEGLLLWLENGRAWERLLNPAQGIYPKVGTITPGGGVGLGAGYRKPGLFNEGSAFSAVGMASFSGYWKVRARLAFPQIADGRVFAELMAETYDYQSEAFYGTGPDSNRADESSFGLRNASGGGLVGVRLGPVVSAGGGFDYLMPVVDEGKKSVPTQDRFTDAEAPGLDRQPDFAHYVAFAEVNTRQPAGNPRRGGLYAVRYERFSDLDFSAYSFDRFHAEVQHYLSIFNERRVLALRGLVSLSSADSGDEVPFYLQETLGGPNDLRGFRRNRFRDTQLLVLQAEYRWEVFTAMDAAVFGDWGQVAPRREDLSLKHLEHDYGMGVRFGTNNGVFLRIEGAFGSRDGRRLVLSFGDVF